MRSSAETVIVASGSVQTKTTPYRERIITNFTDKTGRQFATGLFAIRKAQPVIKSDSMERHQWIEERQSVSTSASWKYDPFPGTIERHGRKGTSSKHCHIMGQKVRDRSSNA